MSDDKLEFILGEITGTLTATKEILVKIEERLDHHSGRLGKLERRQAWLAGLGTAVGLAVGAFLRKWFSS